MSEKLGQQKNMSLSIHGENTNFLMCHPIRPLSVSAPAGWIDNPILKKEKEIQA